MSLTLRRRATASDSSRCPSPSPRRRALTTDRRALALAAALGLLIVALSWYRYTTFRSSTLDLAVFDQAIWKLAHFRSPEVTTIGWNAFADHVSPVLVVFVPFYWLASTPLWLFAAQGLALGLGYLALGPTLDAMGTPTRLRPAFHVAYLASPLLWNAAIFDFHPTTLAVPVLLVGIRAALLDERRRLAWCCLGLVLLRDDLGMAVLVLALIGLAGARCRPGGVRTRLTLAVGGIGWTILGGAVGSALGSDRHWSFHYGYLGSSLADAALRPLRSLGRLGSAVWDGDNLLLVLALVAALGFLPLLRPARLGIVGFLALPLLASAGPQFHSPQWHYGAPLFPFLVWAAAGGAQRIPERWHQPRLSVWLPALAGVTLWIFGPPATRQLTATTVRPADARAALALIGPSDAVAASDTLGARLAQRDLLRIAPFPLASIPSNVPLSSRARSTAPEDVADIDAVVVELHIAGAESQAAEAVGSSPWLSEFPYRARFGDIVIYRRSPPT